MFFAKCGQILKFKSKQADKDLQTVNPMLVAVTTIATFMLSHSQVKPASLPEIIRIQT